MKMCANSLLVRSSGNSCYKDMMDSVEFAREAGFQEITLDFYTPMLTDSGWEKNIADYLDAVSKAGMSVKYTHLPYDYPTSGDAEKMAIYQTAVRRAVDLTASVGAFSTALHAYNELTTDYDPLAEHRKSIEFLSPIVEYANQKNVRIALENMNGAGQKAPQKLRRYATDYADLIHLADDLGTGICWDTGHGYLSMQNIEKALESIGERLLMIHVDDNFGDDDVHLPPFFGKVDFESTVQTLRKIGYQGDMYLEVRCEYRPDSMKKAYVQAIAESCRTLINMFEAQK